MLYAVHKISIIRARIRARFMHIVGVVRAYAHKKINMHTSESIYYRIYRIYYIIIIMSV